MGFWIIFKWITTNLWERINRDSEELELQEIRISWR